MDYNNIKNYIVTTAFCFQQTRVHIQTVNFSTAIMALEHIKTDKARADKWKSSGDTIYAMEIHFVKVYPVSGDVGVYHITEEVLIERADAEKGEVS